MFSPFNDDKLNLIFKKSMKNPQLIGTNEGITIEYKESFGWKSLSEYFRTMAAFANRDGGYIIYGIKNNPHQLIGLNGNSLDNFEEIDKAVWTTNLRDCFSSEIKWDRISYLYEGKTYGVLYTYSADRKPIVSKKDIGELQKAAIYYRYNSQSTKIEFAELLAIIEAEKQKINNLWIQKIKQIESAGIARSAILNLDTGKVNGTNASLYIDQQLLDQISFISDGTFVESGGEPTLRVVGNVQAVTTGPPIIVSEEHELGINYDLIILKFLNQDEIQTPEEYIKQTCYQSAATLPIYYFIHRANYSIDEALQFIKSIENTSNTKQSLINRLEKKISYKQCFPQFDNNPSRIKKQIRSNLISESTYIPSSIEDLKYLLSAIRILTREEIIEHVTFVLETMKAILLSMVYFCGREH